LAFLKLDFEILAFVEYVSLFLEIKKSRKKFGFFWLFFGGKGLAPAKRCLSCILIDHYKSPLKRVLSL